MCCAESEIQEAAELERRTLIVLLGINASMFVIEFLAGWLANAAGLIADSLDMLADASIYAIALYAVGRSVRLQASAAAASGVFQVALGIGVLIDVTRRFVYGSDPVGALMIGFGALALVANVTCLALISKHRSGGVHMRASWIFSANDVLANIGVIVSGALVLWLDSPLPDLAIGVVIAIAVIRGGVKILGEAREGLGRTEIPRS
ncbi:MAG: cation transporter [Actinobacteria bacterium]|nr:cation transporter [Actinomycetota bacterium]